MADTQYLFQPRGHGTAWLFRMSTPSALIGTINPKTGKPFKKEIREGLGTARDLYAARKLRDIRLGEIRILEAQSSGFEEGSVDQALHAAETLKAAKSEDERDTLDSVVEEMADGIARKKGIEKAVRWAKIARGKSLPIQTAYEKYLKDRGKSFAHSSKNNLKNAVEELLVFANGSLGLEDVDRAFVANFVLEFLPGRTSKKSPNGPGPATIRKKVSALNQVWRWAMDRGYIPMEPMTPWDRQGPSKKEIKEAAVKRRNFTPEETRKLLEEVPAGKAIGDVIRIALLTGARLEEIVSLNAAFVDDDGGGYSIPLGKTENAVRYIPLVGEAKRVVAKRLKSPGEDGSLFSDLTVRQSTNKRGGAVSQSFTRLRRKVLGKETDGELVEHSFRHTWRTAARRAGVDLRTAHEMGGWSSGGHTDETYDHGLEQKQYRKEQMRVYRWLKTNKYLSE